MMGQWTSTKLGELCASVASGGTPLRSVSEYYENGTIPWLKTGEVKKGIIFDTEERISESGLENSSAKLIPVNSVIVAMYGDGDTAGNVAINKIPLSTNQACCNFTLDAKRAHYRYIFYYLKGSYNNLINLKLGGSQQNLNAQSLKNFPISHPDVHVQKKIAAILSAYDDLIENNRRRIALLEKMAEEIYREWFVRMRFPGHEQAKFEKGVPEGWKGVLIGDLLKRIPPGKLYEQRTAAESGKVPILDQGQSGIIGYHDNEPGVAASPEKPVIVFANHTCYQRLIFCPFSAIQNVLPFVPSEVNSSNIFWLHYATNRAVELSEYKGHWPAFVTKRIYYPGAALTELFGSIVAPMLKERFQLEKATEVLQESRNLILPRLISGKLDVENLDIQFPPSMLNDAEAQPSPQPSPGGGGSEAVAHA